jgi:hypothetical protein
VGARRVDRAGEARIARRDPRSHRGHQLIDTEMAARDTPGPRMLQPSAHGDVVAKSIRNWRDAKRQRARMPPRKVVALTSD